MKSSLYLLFLEWYSGMADKIDDLATRSTSNLGCK